MAQKVRHVHAALSVLVAFRDVPHPFKDLVGNDLRIHVVDALLPVIVNAAVFFVLEDIIDGIFGKRLAVICYAPCRQRFNDLPHIDALGKLLEHITHVLCLFFIDDDLPVLDPVSIRQASALIVPLEPRLPHPAFDLLREFGGKILVHAFQEAFKDDPLGRIGNVLHCGKHLNAVVGQFLSVDDRFILVAGEPV